MNAYELADQIDWHFRNACPSPALTNAANMLRQQADRIAELEKQLKSAKIGNALVKALDNFPDATPKQSAEPVAYLFKTDQDYAGDVVFPDEVKETKDFYKMEEWEYQLIPLYTTPHHASDVKQIKELSDEEIKQIKADCTKLPPKPWTGTPIARFDEYEFAKAILKKASEK